MWIYLLHGESASGPTRAWFQWILSSILAAFGNEWIALFSDMCLSELFLMQLQKTSVFLLKN